MSEITLRHTDTGSGAPALLFVHGFSSGLEDWDASVAYFANRHRVIVPDLRGHGQTPRGDLDMTIQQLAADCLGLIGSKTIGSVICAGHSMGTRVVLELARQAPDLVKGLILVDGSNTALAGKEAALGHFDSMVAERGFEAYARDLFEAMFFDDRHSTLATRLVDRALSVPTDTALPLYRNMIIWDCDHAEPVMAKVSVPTLVIQSTTRDADNLRRTLAPGETGAYEKLVKRHIPAAEFVAMPGLGHFICHEDPAGLNAAIDAFLDQHDLQ